MTLNIRWARDKLAVLKIWWRAGLSLEGAMLYVFIVGYCLSFIAFFVAEAKGRNYIAWFCWSLALLGLPLMLLIFLPNIKQNPSLRNTKICPLCSNRIIAQHKQCEACSTRVIVEEELIDKPEAGKKPA